MPDQRALLAWRDGVETLVIESAFVGQGTDFAWVVPLPAKPEVESATRGTLASASALMMPVVIPYEPGLWWGAVGLLLVGLVATVFGWRVVGAVFRAGLVAVPGVVGALILAAWIGGRWAESFAGAMTIFGGGIAVALGWKIVRREWSLFEHLMALIAVLLLAMILLPTVGKVRSSLGPVFESSGVRVERSVVGDFDVAIVSGREGDGVVGWLRENGYAIGGEAEKVAREQATSGGWFVASRVRREFAESGRSVPAPLVFRFAAERPVYPMRLTGAGAKNPLELELFVFGPERAVADGLQTVAWGPLQVGNPVEGAYRRVSGQPRDARVITHPVLLRLCEGAAVATHLRGTLSPAQMTTDISPRWEAGPEKSHGLFARARGAVWQAACAAGGGLLFLVSVVMGFRRDGASMGARWSVGAGVAALVCGGLVFGQFPSIATRDAEAGKAVPWYALRQIPQVAILALWELDPAATGDDEARAIFAKEFRKFLDGAEWDMEIGDGPGQVELVKTEKGLWRTILYDAAGQAHFDPAEDFELGGGRSEKTKTQD